MRPMVAPITSLLRVDPERLRQLLIERELAGNPWLSRCGREVIGEVAAQMVQRLPEALDAPLDAVLVEAFRRQPPAWEPPPAAAAGEIAIPLPAQRLRSRHHPALQLQVGEQPLLEVVFDLSLELLLGGVALRLRDGRPWAVAIDRVHGSGILMLERQMLARFSDVPLSLPPLLPLDDGGAAPPAVREDQGSSPEPQPSP